MRNELQCPECAKLIRAADNAGGRNGKCPYCEGKVYIHVPPSPDEGEIKIADDDAEDERREAGVRRGAARYAATLDHEKDNLAPAVEGVRKGAPATRPTEASGEVVNVHEGVEQFVIAMRDSKLEDAERIAHHLRRAAAKAKDYVEGLMLDPTPPPVAKIPKPLLHGFLKNLLERLG